MSAPARSGATRTNSPGLDRGAFYRVCRMLHAYLSAFSFMALIFFSATGILLNHPEWFENDLPRDQAIVLSLSPAEVAEAKSSKDPGRALAKLSAAKASLAGAYASADFEGPMALVRLEGPKGNTDLAIDLRSGAVRGKIGHASGLAILQDLHRGKNSGAAWRLAIDATAYLVMALSLIGYVLLFSLRLRLRTSLILTAAGALVLIAMGWWLAP